MAHDFVNENRDIPLDLEAFKLSAEAKQKAYAARFRKTREPIIDYYRHQFGLGLKA